MEQVLEFISIYGIETVIFALLISIIIWFMRLVNKLVDGIDSIDKRLDNIEQGVTGSTANQSVVVEFMKAFMFPNNNPNNIQNINQNNNDDGGGQ